MNTTVTTIEATPSLVNTTHVVYALHALGLVIGAFGAATVLGSFLFGWPSIIAVIINYVKRGDARGTWLESHFSWQIRTFWFALLWAAVVAVVSAPLTVIGRLRHLGRSAWPCWACGPSTASRAAGCG